MITATLRNGIRVEILSTHRLYNQPRFWVRAITGQPFSTWTHGGWCVTNQTTVSKDEIIRETVQVNP